MVNKGIIVGIAGIIVCIVVGFAGIFYIQNDFIQLPLLGGVTGVGAFLIYSMGHPATQMEAEPTPERTFADSQGAIESRSQPESRQVTFQETPETVQEPKGENHGVVVRTATKNGRVVYIEFADGHSLGKLPSSAEEDNRDRYEAVKV
jgi:hypothetical protein